MIYNVYAFMHGYEIQGEDNENTLLFEDGVRKIDYILTYTNVNSGHDYDDNHNEKIMRRNYFLDRFEEHGLEYEIQDCSVRINIAIYIIYYSKLKLHELLCRWEFA